MSKPTPFAPRLTLEQQLAYEWEQWEYFDQYFGRLSGAAAELEK